MANSYLSRTPSSAGNRKNLLYLHGLKEHKSDSNQEIFLCWSYGGSNIDYTLLELHDVKSTGRF